MNRWDGLAGSLVLAPGRPVPNNIIRHRPAGLRRLLCGRPADAWPDLTAAVFTLCGHVHRATALRAVAAARGFVETPGQREVVAQQWHTAREHVRRILLDWEMPTALARESAARSLSNCPLLHTDDQVTGLRALGTWLQVHLLGLPPAEWLDRWDRGGAAWLAEWCDSHDGAAAAFLRSVRERAQQVNVAAQPLLLGGDEAAQRNLAAQLAAVPEADDEEAMAPLAQDGVETGAWTRQCQGKHGKEHNAWMRMASRLIDLARLGAHEGAGWLGRGALTTAPGEAMAWTEMARGLLVHWVRLDAGRVSHCRVLAPTDWNFHPRGAFAQALPQLEEGDALLLSAAFDPCVPARLAAQAEVSNA